MGRIIIERSKEFRNSVRNYNIVLDGNIIGNIGNGETKEFDVPIGNHFIFAKIDWCTSKTINFEIDNNKNNLKLKIAAFKKSNFLTFSTGILVFLMIALRRTVYREYIPFLGIPIFFIIIYYITIGRKRYLTLSEII